MSEKIDIRSEAFKVTENTENDEIEITGVAVPYEVESRNGIIYSKESIRNAAETLEGKPLLFNHDPDQVLGKVVNVNPTDTHLEFTAKADPSKEKVQDMKKGYVSTVSIQAMVNESEEGEDNRVDVEEFLELSAAPIPGFNEAQADAQAVRIEEFDINTEQKDWVVQDVEYDLAVRTNWDGVDKEEFPNEATWMKVHLIRHNDEYHLPIAHYEDDQIKLVYEALNSAYDLIENIEGIPAETISEAKNVLERFRNDEFPDAPPLDADANENKDTMTEEENQNSEEPESETQEQDIEDLADALDWLDANAPEEVTAMIQDAIQSDEESDDMEDDEEEEEEVEEADEGEEESDTEEEDSDNAEEEEEKIDKLENRIDELERKLEEEEEVEESKQPGVGTEDNDTTAEDLANEISRLTRE